MTDELHSCGFHCPRRACVEARAREWEQQRKRIAELEAERNAIKQELASVLSDWNDLVQASGARSNGGAIGFVRAMRAERDTLKAALEVAFDYAMQNISDERQRFAGYKPERHAQWAKDEALMRAALAAKGE